jgi:hypothetical protein
MPTNNRRLTSPVRNATCRHVSDSGNGKRTLLALSAEQRVLLTESLLDSLPPVGDVWSEAEDLFEVERRERQIESGEVQPLADAKSWRRVAAVRKGESRLPSRRRTGCGRCPLTLRRGIAAFGRGVTAELCAAVVAAKLGRFHLIKPVFHRANLKRFPYHFVYRESMDGIGNVGTALRGHITRCVALHCPTRVTSLAVF